MTSRRLILTVLLLLVVASPLAALLVDVVGRPSAWGVWAEADRILGLARNSLLFIGGTLLLSFLAGVVAAVLLYRTDLPGRGLFRFLVVLTLFVPLPLFASGWQAAFGWGGWLPLDLWNLGGTNAPPRWTPWGLGLWSAMWIHAVAAVPWVIVLAGQGLKWVERDLEEDALLAAPAWRVILGVTLPRARAALAAAALWVVLQAGTEIAVTDLFQVRTFAEEVYTQFVRPEASGPGDDVTLIVARAVVVSLPTVLLTVGLVMVVARAWERRLPPLLTRREPLEFRLGWRRWPVAVVVGVMACLLFGVPVLSLAWKAGQTGYPPTWSAFTAWDHLQKVTLAHGKTVLTSAGAAMAAGMIAATLALLACWLAVGSRWMQTVLLILAAATWAVPGPLVALGLQKVFLGLIDLTGWEPVGWLLYYRPSYVPPAWACVLRFFGCAVAVLWPVVRMVPRDLGESARVDGATPGQEFRLVVWPMTWLAWLAAAWVVAVLTLGELGASKMVATAGAPMLSHEVFALMHNGVTNDLAALCLLVLLVVAAGGVVVACVLRLSRGRDADHGTIGR